MKTRPQLTALALILTTAIAPMVWGTTYLVTTELLPTDRPLLAGLLRALPAGIVLAAITRSRPRGTWWFKGALLGVLNIGGFFALLFLAAFRLPGGVAATLGAIQPLIAAALAAALLGERMGRLVSFAGILGVTGVGFLVAGAEARLDAVGVFAGLGGAASMAMGVVLTKRWGRPTSLLAFTSWQLIAGGLFLLPLALIVEGVPQTISLANVAGFLWLASVGTAVAYALWFRGVQILPIAQVTLLGLLSPVVAAIAGWLVLGQSLSPAQFGGMAIVLTAIGIAVLFASAKTAEKPPSLAKIAVEAPSGAYKRVGDKYRAQRTPGSPSPNGEGENHENLHHRNHPFFRTHVCSQPN